MLSDEQIMLQISNGQVDKTAILFDRYHTLLYNYYKKNTYDQSLSEDLVQTVFEKLMKYKTSFKADHSFRSWLFKIANNVLHDHYRREKSHKNRNEVYYKSTEKFLNPDTNGHQQYCEKLLHQALNKLPHEQKEIIWLTRFEKMRYADLAEIWGCSESAIKVKVHRAMKKLKTEYLQLYK